MLCCCVVVLCFACTELLSGGCFFFFVRLIKLEPLKAETLFQLFHVGLVKDALAMYF